LSIKEDDKESSVEVQGLIVKEKRIRKEVWYEGGSAVSSSVEMRVAWK